jgi:hypothetical protein
MASESPWATPKVKTHYNLSSPHEIKNVMIGQGGFAAAMVIDKVSQVP